MPTITVTGSSKMFYKGKAYRPGQSFEMSEHDYSQLQVESPKQSKQKKDNERISKSNNGSDSSGVDGGDTEILS